MPRKRFSRRQLILVAVSLLDDVIILTVLILIFSHFIRVPIWFIIPVASLVAGWSILSFLAVRRNPQLGFEDMIGATGVVIDPLSPTGTIRIGHERWAARASQTHLGLGVEVLVVGQSGLLLTVVSKEGESSERRLGDPHETAR